MPLTFEECKTRAAAAIAEHQPEIATELGGTGPTFEIDWSSFEGASNPQRVFYHLTSWTGYYTFGYVKYAIRECVREYEGGDKLKALKKVIFRHVNEGKDREQRVRIEDNNLIIEASCCCTWHWVYTSDIVVQLVIMYELFDGYIKKINEAMPDASAKFAGVTCETDWDTFDFTKVAASEFKAKEMKANALKAASSWSCWYSWRSVGWAGDSGWYEDYTDDEKRKAFSKIVIKCKNWKPAPAKVSYWWWDQSEVSYSIETKTITIRNCFADERYSWNSAGSWDIRRVVNQVLRLYRLGQFEEMDGPAHDKKMEFLQEVCCSWEVQRGDFEWLRKVIQYPAFYPKDNHERNAANIFVEFINTEAYRKTLMEDTAAAEAEAWTDKGLDPAAPEELVGAWLVTKINWKGMQQDRLVVVTDRATYTCVPKYKGKANKKKIHRISHEHYSYINVGELKTRQGGAPTVGGGKMPNMPDVLPDVKLPDVKLPDVDMPDVNLPDVNMPGLPGMPGMGGFRGPPHALRLESTRLRKEDEPPKKFKMPEIPDLPAKICAMFSDMIEAIKDIEMPSIPRPKMPKLSCPDLLGLLSKAKPSMPSGSAAAETRSNPNACDADLPVLDAPMGSIADSLKEAGVEDPDMDEEPPAKVPDMLTKVLDKIKGIASFEFMLPDEFSLVGLLKSFMKSLAKLTGLDGIELPKMPNLNPLAAIQKIIDKLGAKASHAVAGFPSLGDMLNSLKSAAGSLGDLVMDSAPMMGLKKVLGHCISILSSIKVPLPSIDIGKYLPNIKLPSMPDIKMPKLPGIGGKMPTVKMGESPVKNNYVQFIVKPILKKSLEGASKYVCLEMAWVIQAAARGYRRSWVSGISTADQSVLASASAGIYNKLGRALGKGVSTKPSGDGDAPDEDDEEDGDDE